MKNNNYKICIEYNHEGNFYDISILGKHIKIKDGYKISKEEKDHIRDTVKNHYFSMMPKGNVQTWVSSPNGGFFKSEDKSKDIQEDYEKIEKVLNDFLSNK